MESTNNIELSIVVSVYNEADGLASFWNELKNEFSRMTQSVEVIFVNDGSTDRSSVELEMIQKESTGAQVGIIEFSRNYGHEAAMIAGIDESIGHRVICMDADLQHPPSVIGSLIAEADSGADIVLAERKSRADNGLLKNAMSGLFYGLINRLSSFKLTPNSTDFFLISRPVAEVLKRHFRDRNRFIRGFIQSIGFTKATVSFDAPARKFGKSNYAYADLFDLATTAIFSYSNKPLRISILISVLFIILTIILAIYSIDQYVSGNTPPSGYTTIILFLSTSFAALFGVIAILSLYFEKALEEQRDRPIYIVKNKV